MLSKLKRPMSFLRTVSVLKPRGRPRGKGPLAQNGRPDLLLVPYLFIPGSRSPGEKCTRPAKAGRPIRPRPAGLPYLAPAWRRGRGRSQAGAPPSGEASDQRERRRGRLPPAQGGQVASEVFPAAGQGRTSVKFHFVERGDRCRNVRFGSPPPSEPRRGEDEYNSEKRQRHRSCIHGGGSRARQTQCRRSPTAGSSAECCPRKLPSTSR